MKYTNKQLESMTDMELAADIVREKLAKLCNPYSPFASKLRRVYHSLCEQATQEKFIEQITTAATDEIWGSLEQGPTGNYWIDEVHNLACEKNEDGGYDVKLEEYAGIGEYFSLKRDVATKSTDEPLCCTARDALKDVLRRLISDNTSILDLSQTARSDSGGGK